MANALYVWGLARAGGGPVVLRIEDHDRQRSRPEHEAALLEDLAWLGFVPDAPSIEDLAARAPSPFRQSDSGPAYAAALERLRDAVAVYACDCSRATFVAWAAATGGSWDRPGCPGRCRERRVPETAGRALRAAVGDGVERWDDLLVGPQAGAVALGGDLVVRDRLGNWTYGFAVVVDDLRQGIGLVVRGADLVADTPRQIRLGRLLGRPTEPRFAHHPLVRRADGSKLSKSAGDTGVRELRATGRSAEDVVGLAAAAVGLVPFGRLVRPEEASDLVVAEVPSRPPEPSARIARP